MKRMNRLLALALLALGVSSLAVAQSATPAATSAPASATALVSADAATPTDASADSAKTAGDSGNVIHHIATPSVQPPALSESDLPELALPSPTLSELAPPVHPATPAQIREFLKLTHAAESAHSRIAANLKLMRASSPNYIPAAFWIDVQRAMMGFDIVDLCIPAYQKYYSQEDMAAALAFYRSPAGRRMIAAEPFVASILNDAMTQAATQVSEKIGLKYKDQLEKLKSQPPSGMDVVVTSN